MIEINIKRKIGSSRYLRSIPVRWLDITNDERRIFLFKLSIIHKRERARVEVLRSILDLPKSVFNALSDLDIECLCQKIDWIFDKSTELPIQNIVQCDGITYFLPSAHFDNGTAFEFALADEHYINWIKDMTQAESLFIAIATLLRTDPKKPNLNKDEIIERSKKLHTVEIEYLALVLHYFESLKQDIHDIGSRVGLFEQKKTDKSNDDATKEEIPEPEKIDFGWWTSFRSIAKSGVFGDFEKVCASNFFDVFKFCIEEKQRADAHEAEMNRIMR